MLKKMIQTLMASCLIPLSLQAMDPAFVKSQEENVKKINKICEEEAALSILQKKQDERIKEMHRKNLPYLKQQEEKRRQDEIKYQEKLAEIRKQSEELAKKWYENRGK